MRGFERVLLLPALDLLDHGLSDEVSNPVEVVVGIDNPYQVFVVAPFDPPGHRHLGEETLPGLGQWSSHRRYSNRRKDL